MSRVPDLVGIMRDRLAQQLGPRPCHDTTASEIGASCLRQLVYKRTHWDKAKPVSVELAEVFMEGHMHEAAVLETLREVGVTVIGEQRRLVVTRCDGTQIVGHCDAIVLDDEGHDIPIDVKSSSEHIWRSIAFRGAGIYQWEEVGAAFNARPWLRKYYPQIVLYADALEAPYGLLLLKNKSTGAIAQVVVYRDSFTVSQMLDRARLIAAQATAGVLPDRIDWDAHECGRCPFLHLCQPERNEQPVEKFIPDAEIARMCAVREANDEARRRFDEADAEVKAWAKAQDADQLVVSDGNGNTFAVSRTSMKNGVRVAIVRR